VTASSSPPQALTDADGADASPVPRAFVARTVHVYRLPAVKCATVIGEAVPVFERVAPPLDETHAAVYPVIALPLFAPGVNLTFSEPAATLTAVTCVGAAGAPTIAAADGSLAGPVPRAFVARTVHVYRLPVVKLVTVNGDAVPVFVWVAPPLFDAHLAVNPVIALPLRAPALNDTFSGPVALVVEPGTAFTSVGAPGGLAVTVTDADAPLGALSPAELTATTRRW